MQVCCLGSPNNTYTQRPVQKAPKRPSKRRLLVVIDSGLDQTLAGPLWEGCARAEDAQGTPTQSHISPSIQRILRYMTAHHIEGGAGGGGLVLAPELF